jgi:hypothetical protein
MGAKNASDAKAAQDGAKDQPGGDAPAQNEAPVKPCKNKHWIAVRVQWEDTGKLVETGIQKKLDLNNGERRNITLNPGAQPGGKYSTGMILDSTDDCHISFPDMYAAEIKPQ